MVWLKMFDGKQYINTDHLVSLTPTTNREIWEATMTDGKTYQISDAEWEYVRDYILSKAIDAHDDHQPGVRFIN